MSDPKQDEVPLPAPGINTASHAHFRVVGFTTDQMRAYGQACALAASMRAAQVCMERIGYWQKDDGRCFEDEMCALAIEADAGIKGDGK